VDTPEPDSMQFKMLVQRIGEISRKLEQNPNLIKADPITVKPVNIDELKKKSGQRISGIDPKRPRVVDNPFIEASKLPADLQKLYFENKSLTKEIGQLHQELKAVPKGDKFNNKRKELAQKITSKDDKRAANWKEIDTWWVQHELKTDEQKQEFAQKKEEMLISFREAKVIFNRIETLKINIQREEKRCKTSPILKEKYAAKIDDWKKELVELEEKVK
jgi:hypothetical protein